MNMFLLLHTSKRQARTRLFSFEYFSQLMFSACLADAAAYCTWAQAEAAHKHIPQSYSNYNKAPYHTPLPHPPSQLRCQKRWYIVNYVCPALKHRRGLSHLPAPHRPATPLTPDWIGCIFWWVARRRHCRRRRRYFVLRMPTIIFD